MDSYIELKEKISKIENELKYLHDDRLNIFMPIYDMINSYSIYLSNILPDNIDSVSNEDLEFKMKVFLGELVSLKIDENKKQKMVNEALKIKERITNRNREIELLNGELVKLKPLMEKRRVYLLEKKEIVDEKNAKISELKSIIIKHKNFQTKDNWDSAVNIALQSTINEYDLELNRIKNELDVIYKEKNLKDDIEFLNNELNIHKEEPVSFEEDIKNENNDNLIDSTTDDNTNDFISDPLSLNLSEVVNKISTNIETQFDDSSYFEYEIEEFSENDLEVDSSYPNLLLANKIKALKKNKMIFGLLSLAAQTTSSVLSNNIFTSNLSKKNLLSDAKKICNRADYLCKEVSKFTNGKDIDLIMDISKKKLFRSTNMVIRELREVKDKCSLNTLVQKDLVDLDELINQLVDVINEVNQEVKDAKKLKKGKMNL